MLRPDRLPDLPPGVRALGPAGVPCVGAPPVPVRVVAGALDRARGDVTRSLTLLPALAPAEVEAAQRLIEQQPEALDPRPPVRALLGLALPLGLGAALLAPAGLLPLFVLLMLVIPIPDETGSLVRDLGRVLGAAVVGVAPGVLLWRLSIAGRAATVALGLGAPLIVVAAERFILSLWELVPGALVGAPALLLLAPMRRAWFTPDGVGSAPGLSVRPYRAAALALAVLASILVFVVPPFRRVFARLGAELPLATELVFRAGDVVEDHSYLVIPLLVLAPAPLLLVSHRREPLALWGAVTGGLLAIWAVFLALVRPFYA
ncbi:MAG: hypothetical protein M9894_21815 [Planctomycetes bacterium]|nr:hypothetical protein [Planctomycetota bacterium]